MILCYILLVCYNFYPKHDSLTFDGEAKFSIFVCISSTFLIKSVSIKENKY